MKTWITSDWHIGEDRFSIMQRPFKEVDEHIDHLINCHNLLVKNDDLVYVNGDVLYQKADPSFLNHIARFNGKKILLRGNHDRPFTDEQFSPYFETIIPEGEGLHLDVEGIPCQIVHYPSLAVKDRFNLVGHIHGAWKFQLNSLNVGVDVNHFCPIDLNKDIPFFLNAITNFYDNDVWAGYNDANQSFFSVRGKKSNYFEKPVV